MNSRKTLLFTLTIVALYLTLSFGFSDWIDSLGTYASYYIDVAVVVIVGLIYRNRLRFAYPLRRQFAADYGLSFLAGIGIFLLTTPLGLSVPFDFSSTETVLFLVIIGPILEEFLFRMALWEPLFDLLDGRWQIALAINCLLFTYSHFHAYWSVPSELRSFVLYQTIYVIPLSLACGWRRWRTGSLAPPFSIHLGFNMGFFLAGVWAGGV